MRAGRKRGACRTWMPGGWLLCVLLGGLPAAAQAPPDEAGPAGPPPPSGRAGPGGVVGLELLPEIGRVGAQVGFTLGPAWQPYDVGTGWQGSGYIDLPLARGFGGRLSYEIFISLSGGESQPFVITNAIAFVANLAAGATPQAALAGPPAAPFPVRSLVRMRLRILQVSPFALKHTFTGLDHLRLRPYVTAGADAVVVITSQRPERDESLLFTGSAPFDDDLIAGLVAQAPELSQRGVPAGAGNLEFGAHVGGGLELRLARGVSANLDYRFTRFGGRAQAHTAALALGIHW